MKKIFLIILFFLILSFTKNEKLIFVELQCRHGARAPLDINDNNEDLLGVKWSNPGELTAVGQRMEYILGLKNRYRYITNTYNFLSEKYDPHELLVFSTDVNRTILSMTSQLLGLYPISSKKGEALNPQQIDISVPPVNISFEEIEKEVENLNESALPNYMTIIPIHTISQLEKRIVVYDHPDCKENVGKLKQKNGEEKEDFVKATKNFIEKYSKNLSNFLTFEEDPEFIGKICDATIAGNTEGKNMSAFFTKTKIDKNDLLTDCKIFLGLNFRDKLYGDDKREVILTEVSQLLREMLHYMKQRVDADISGENMQKKVSDYSRPKMVMVSGHDTTLTAHLLFFIKFFGLPLETYKLTSYASQIAVEVARDDNKDNKKLKYSDYKARFYFNDLLIIDEQLDKFIDTIEKSIWSKEEIDYFCFGGKGINIYLIIIIAISLFATILLIILIAVILKMKKMAKDSDNTNTNINSIDKNKLVNEDEE